VSLYKSYFPLKYGGRTSSVIDVKMREGNNQEKHRSATIGVIASKIQLEGPIKKGKTSYLVAGRFAYPGAVLNVLKQFRGTKMRRESRVQTVSGSGEVEQLGSRFRYYVTLLFEFSNFRSVKNR